MYGCISISGNASNNESTNPVLKSPIPTYSSKGLDIFATLF
jgi:hypothetical protein